MKTAEELAKEFKKEIDAVPVTKTINEIFVDKIRARDAEWLSENVWKCPECHKPSVSHYCNNCHSCMTKEAVAKALSSLKAELEEANFGEESITIRMENWKQIWVRRGLK